MGVLNFLSACVCLCVCVWVFALVWLTELRREGFQGEKGPVKTLLNQLSGVSAKVTSKIFVCWAEITLNDFFVTSPIWAAGMWPEKQITQMYLGSGGQNNSSQSEINPCPRLSTELKINKTRMKCSNTDSRLPTLRSRYRAFRSDWLPSIKVSELQFWRCFRWSTAFRRQSTNNCGTKNVSSARPRNKSTVAWPSRSPDFELAKRKNVFNKKITIRQKTGLVNASTVDPSSRKMKNSSKKKAITHRLCFWPHHLQLDGLN